MADSNHTSQGHTSQGHTSQDMRTPLARAYGIGVATHGGTGHFWQQRLTALANIPLVLALLIVFSLDGARDANGFKILLATPWISLCLILAIGSICWHMRLGVASVIEDYVHAPRLNLFCLIANDFAAFITAAISLWALLRLVFGV